MIYELPKECPHDGRPLVWAKDGGEDALFCVNGECVKSHGWKPAWKLSTAQDVDDDPA